jgi:hypothetical protein
LLSSGSVSGQNVPLERTPIVDFIEEVEGIFSKRLELVSVRVPEHSASRNGEAVLQCSRRYRHERLRRFQFLGGFVPLESEQSGTVSALRITTVALSSEP